MILITGGTGFLGRHLATHLGYPVVLTGRNNKQNQLASQYAPVYPMDITNIESIRDVFREVKPTTVIHAAATKFVDLSEKFPMECVDVNVLGSQNVSRVCMEFGVDKVLAISTDKAAPPVRNIYGMSKAMMEKTYCALNRKTNTRFACVRYGNVAWSTGSALPIWQNMAKTGTITSTGWDMTRYFFTVYEAVELVKTALDNFDFIEGGILCHNMKSSRVSVVLDIFCKLFDCKWVEGDRRPGERNNEFLVGESELEFTEKFLEDHYFITPNKKSLNPPYNALHSGNAVKLTPEEIEKLCLSMPLY